MVELKHYWYNINPDLPRPLPPPKDPDEYDERSRVETLPTLLTPALIDQEISAERYIPIPDDVLEVYRGLGRPTPLVRARRLEKHLGTPAKIFFKREDVNPTGSHKPNTAIPQAYYAKADGVETLTTETGAGQWGSAVALACSLFGVKSLIYMTRSSYLQKPGRKMLMNIYGAEVVPSPSDRTKVGAKFYQQNPDHPGSLGIAMSEAVETVLTSERCKYAVGSVLNFTLLHQSVIGLEAIQQMEEAEPDVVVGCVGGGSNFAGLCFPFLGSRLRGEGFEKTRFVAAESKSAPKMTQGVYAYEYADTAGYLPQLKMHNIGREHVPPPIHAAGLRYHGVAPAISVLIREGLVEPYAYTQEEAFNAALLFARVEGLLPAPETAHAIKFVIDEATACRRHNTEKTILFCFSGHGLLDLQSYEAVGIPKQPTTP